MNHTISRMSFKRMFLFIQIILSFMFFQKKKRKKKKKKTQRFCSKEENQRDCVVYINLNKIDEAWKKKYVVKKEIKEIVQVYIICSGMTPCRIPFYHTIRTRNLHSSNKETAEYLYLLRTEFDSLDYCERIKLFLITLTRNLYGMMHSFVLSNLSLQITVLITYYFLYLLLYQIVIQY